ncbi:MAG: hypothetical protein V7L02_08810, partial [Nostoc sp.]|uniref:hypothetical protein n=1 Tax=Nostoc sp. TaxID=1180 RepID=UPI002FFC3EE6
YCIDINLTILPFFCIHISYILSKQIRCVSPGISRARIWTDWQGNALLEGYVPSGIGTKINLSKKTLSTRIKIMN